MKELVEKVEVDGQDGVAHIDAACADQNSSCLVQEAKSVDSMRWLGSLPDQKG